MGEKINILCTPDNNYIPYCGIMLTSLFENNKDLDFVIYIICETLNNNNKKALDTLSQKYNVDINVIYTNNDIFTGCPIREGDHVSIAAYYRLLAPTLLPKDIEKILYLDPDIIINNSIKELYNQNIDNYSMGAVVDEAYFVQERYERLQYSSEFPHINSGVILFNLEYWREKRLSHKCMDYIYNNGERVILHDQDTLNAVLHDSIKYLPITYNFQTGFMFTHFKYEKNFFDEINKVVLTPSVIHYTGNNKPWKTGCKHPYLKRFLYYKKQSLWKNHPLTPNKRSLKNRIRTLIYGFLCIIGLKKQPKMFIIEDQI